MHRIALLLAVASITCILTALSQQNPTEGRKFVMVPTMAGSRPVAVAALNISHGANYPASVHLTGDVEIKTPVCLPTGRNSKLVCDGSMIVRADDAVLHEDTGEIEAHGNVVITPLRHEK